MSDSVHSAERKTMLQAVSQLWWLPLLRGILLVILGAYALLNPGMTAEMLTKVIGIWVIAEGIVAIIAAVLGKTPSRLWTGVRGVLLILVGVFVFGHSAIVAGIAATTILYIIAFFAVLAGILEIVAAIQDRKQIEGEGWIMLNGILMILFGVILFIAPLSFGMLIVRVLGFFAIINGVSLIALAFRIRGIGKSLNV
jgi:uncharacterized membrane protein HdeD (DUF308 family)